MLLWFITSFYESLNQLWHDRKGNIVVQRFELLMFFCFFFYCSDFLLGKTRPAMCWYPVLLVKIPTLSHTWLECSDKAVDLLHLCQVMEWEECLKTKCRSKSNCLVLTVHDQHLTCPFALSTSHMLSAVSVSHALISLLQKDVMVLIYLSASLLWCLHTGYLIASIRRETPPSSHTAANYN